jgi:branched-chain amino acid transport system permease protein
MGLPCGTYNDTYNQDMAIVRTRLQWGLLIFGLIFLFTLPFYLGAEWLPLVNLIGISIVAAQGLNILTGSCGQISLGHAAFIMVGAYTSAWLTTKFGFSFWAALPIAGLSAGIVGLIFGIPSLRVKGFYLAMATLAAQFIIPWCIRNIQPEWTGGCYSIRVPAPTIGSMTFNTQFEMFYIIMPFACLATFFAKNLLRTKMGRAFVAIRDNDLAAEVMGIDIFRHKLYAFFICSIFAGVAGSLWAHWMRVVSYTYFDLDASIWYLGMIIVGGMGSVMGACAGAAVIRGLDYSVALLGPLLAGILPGLTTASDVTVALKPLVFGLIIITFIILEPRGISHRWEIWKASYRLWPFSY